MMSQRKSGGHMDILPPGMKMGQRAKNWGGKRNAWIAGHLPGFILSVSPVKAPDYDLNNKCWFE